MGVVGCMCLGKLGSKPDYSWSICRCPLSQRMAVFNQYGAQRCPPSLHPSKRVDIGDRCTQGRGLRTAWKWKGRHTALIGWVDKALTMQYFEWVDGTVAVDTPVRMVG